MTAASAWLSPAVRSASMVDWGDFPTWVQAIATVALFVAAVIAGKLTYRIYKIESGRDEDRYEDRLREQASKVAAWVDTRPGYVLIARNASELPVYDVVIEYLARYERNMKPMPIGTEERPLLPPGGRGMPIPSGVRNVWSSGGPKKAGAMLLARVEFRDSGGRTWCRDHEGKLWDLDATSRTQKEERIHRWRDVIQRPVRAVHRWRRKQRRT